MIPTGLTSRVVLGCAALFCHLSSQALAQWQQVDAGGQVLGIDAQFLPTSAGQTVAICGFRPTTSQGVFLKSTDAGATWSTVNLGFNFLAQAMHFPDDQTGWITTSNGGLLKTTDVGSTWATQNVGSTQVLYAVWFINANTGWVAGTGGAVFKTTNGGASWTDQSIATVQHWNDLWFSGTMTGWVVGQRGNIRKTTDGGATWVALPSIKADTLNDVQFLDELQGWVVGADGRVYMKVNGGLKWTAVSPLLGESLQSVAFANTGVGVVTGAANVFRYFEGSLLNRVETNHVAKTKLPVPQLTDVTYRTLGSAAVSGFGHATFAASMIGKEASKVRNQVMLRATGILRRVIAQSKVALPCGQTSGTPVQPIMNQAESLCVVPLSGVGVTARTNRAVLVDNGTTTNLLLRKGDLISGLGPQAVEVSVFREVLQSALLNAVAISYGLRRDAATEVKSSNDTGLLVLNHSGLLTAGAAREGASAFGGVGTFGQFVGRAACQQSGIVCFGASYVPTGEKRGVQGLFWMGANGTSDGFVAGAGTEFEAGSEVKLRSLRTGQAAPDAGGAVFTAFTGLLVTGPTEYPLVVAKLRSQGAAVVSNANNTGVWGEVGGQLRLLLRTGDSIAGANPAAVVKSIALPQTVPGSPAERRHEPGPVLFPQVTFTDNSKGILAMKTGEVPALLIRTGQIDGAGRQYLTLGFADVDRVNGELRACLAATWRPGTAM